MNRPARPEPERLAGLHHRLQAVEEQLRVLEHDLHATRNQRPRTFQRIHTRGDPARSGSLPPLARSTRSPYVLLRGSTGVIDDLVLEVAA